MIDEKLRGLATGPNFATFTTLMRDGRPQSSLVWIGVDDDHVLVNTEVNRQKFRNVERDPRVGLLVVDRNDPWNYVEVRGTVVEKVTGPEARAHIDELSMKYRGAPYDPAMIKSERVILRIEPQRTVPFPPAGR